MTLTAWLAVLVILALIAIAYFPWPIVDRAIRSRLRRVPVRDLARDREVERVAHPAVLTLERFAFKREQLSPLSQRNLSRHVRECKRCSYTLHEIMLDAAKRSPNP